MGKRVMQTLKEELFWLREWKSTRQMEQAFPTWVEWLNRPYYFLALGYQMTTEREIQFHPLTALWLTGKTNGEQHRTALIF